MLRKDARVELLRRVPLFSVCSKRDLAKLATIADEIDIPAGETLIHEGRPGSMFYVIVDGGVAVTRKGRPVQIRGGSEFFGEISLVTDAPTNATITASSPVHALVITEPSFRRLMRTAPAIQAKVLRALAERLAPDAL